MGFGDRGGPGRKGPPLNAVELQEYRYSIGRLNDNELARQYIYLHKLVELRPGEPTPNARAVQEFVQVWREANRRGRITPLPNVR